MEDRFQMAMMQQRCEGGTLKDLEQRDNLTIEKYP
jgi:hypothetical protein